MMPNDVAESFNRLGIGPDEADKIIEKAEIGGEINESCDLRTWLNERFVPNTILIPEDGYAKMCVDALKILGRTAATDYGGSRQRDLGQLWADMTRGYLGELAFSMFLKENWDIECELGHEEGRLEDFLPMDIHRVREAHGTYITPRIGISIKTTKWNGIWLDIPGNQFEHSDIHVLAKVGTGRDHLFAFFKAISVFRDKVLEKGKTVGSLTEQEADALFGSLPSFRPVPSYICGFVRKEGTFQDLSYSGHRGRMHFTITSWNGPINPGDLDQIKRREGISGEITFKGIGKFAHDRGYLFNAGNLLWKRQDWDALVRRLIGRD